MNDFAGLRPPEGNVLMDNMPAEHYHAVEALSFSGSAKLLRSPAHYLYARKNPPPPSEPMAFGSAVHCGVLEPHLFDSMVIVAPSIPKRSAQEKDIWAAFERIAVGKIALKPDQFDRARRCIDAVLAHPAARQLLDGAKVEQSLFWRDGKHGVPCKCRRDISSHGGITDLKTTSDASPDEFARSIVKWGYHRQAAHYFSGAEHVENATPQFFAFIAVESEAPHAVACYSLPGNAVMAGAFQMGIAMERYAEAVKSGEWKSYPIEIQRITLPRWALKFDL